MNIGSTQFITGDKMFKTSPVTTLRHHQENRTELLRKNLVGLVAGVALFLAGSTAIAPLAHAGENMDAVRAINAAISKHQNNIDRMKGELAANPRNPDASKLRDVLATAGGQRSNAFNNLNPELQKLVNKFEGSVEKNVGGSAVMALGLASPRTQFIIEISRSTQLVNELKNLRSTLIDKAIEEAYQERIDRLEREREEADNSAPASPTSTGPSDTTTSSSLPRPTGWGNSGWGNPGNSSWGNPGRGPTRTASNWPGRDPRGTRGTGGRPPKGAGASGNCHTNPTTGAQHCLGNKASSAAKDRFAKQIDRWKNRPAQARTRTAAASRRPAAGSRMPRGLGRAAQARAPRFGARGMARGSQMRAPRMASRAQMRAPRMASRGGRGFGRRR